MASSVAATCLAGELLVSDRLSNSVYRYGDDGSFLGVLLVDNVNLNQPSGVQVSPDRSKLYVASSQTNTVMQYDYDFAGGSASNPVVFADAADGIAFPNSILFSEDGETIYVSNLGGTGVARFNTDGSSAGAAINGSVGGGSVFQYSGLAFAPGGELLVGGFQDFPAGTSGAVAKSDAGISTISDFIGPDATLNGAGSLLVDGSDLFVAAGFAGRVNKYDATTGAVDGAFTPIVDLEFPTSLAMITPGEFLIGTLGLEKSTGAITRYDLDGNLLGVFASAQSDPMNGFLEASAMVYVAARLTGDFDDDGDVDGDDFLTWQANFGLTKGAETSDGDADGDGDVDGDDFLAWQANFGSGVGATGAVPEPASVILVLFGVLAFGLGARMRAY